MSVWDDQEDTEIEIEIENYDDYENDDDEDDDGDDGSYDENEPDDVTEDEADDMNADQSDSEFNEIDEDSFVDEMGNVQVMDPDNINEDGFELKYLNIDTDIIVAERIRKKQSEHLLEDSIRSTGLLQPVVVAPTMIENKYILISGLRRLLACRKVGMTRVPSIVNNKLKTTQIPIVEALYNHGRKYPVQDKLDFIRMLETDRNITSASTIEYLLEMENGDYNKLKDLADDNDEDIMTPLLAGSIDIQTAYKKLEQRRRKEGVDVREAKKVKGTYEGGDEASEENLSNLGDTSYDKSSELTDEQIADLNILPSDIDDEVANSTLQEIAEDGSGIEGYEPEKQKVGERHPIDPAIRKAVMARDDNTCRCCGMGGPSYVDAMDFHHVVPVFLGGRDTSQNGICICLVCHKLVHLYARNQLYVPREEDMTEDEVQKFKRIVAYGNRIRKGVETSGKQLEEYKKQDGIRQIGRQMPGKQNTVS